MITILISVLLVYSIILTIDKIISYCNRAAAMKNPVYFVLNQTEYIEEKILSLPENIDKTVVIISKSKSNVEELKVKLSDEKLSICSLDEFVNELLKPDSPYINR